MIVIIAILTNFFYARRNVSSCFSMDSSKLLSMLNNEIVLFKRNNSTTTNNNTNKILAQNTDYKKETINNEFSFIKMVAAQSMEDINLANQNNNTNLGNNNENSANIQENSINVDKNTTNIELAEAQTNVSVEVLPSNVSNKYTHEIFGVQLKNESDYNLSAEITDLNIDFNKNEIMIFHTHTCESYTPTEQYQYQASGNFRTTDLNYSVARVGDELEKYFYKFEKIRMDMYDDVRQTNLWLDFMDAEGIEIIDYQYKARLEDNILKIHIPEKVPSIKRGANYVQKQIAYNVAKVVKQYQGLFYDNSVIVIIKIFDDTKIWDVDNRNVKPIQDGLIQGRVIKDDNIYCSSYMVQGYYSDRPYIEVYVLPAEEITKIINQKIR